MNAESEQIRSLPSDLKDIQDLEPSPMQAVANDIQRRIEAIHRTTRSGTDDEYLAGKLNAYQSMKRYLKEIYGVN